MNQFSQEIFGQLKSTIYYLSYLSKKWCSVIEIPASLYFKALLNCKIYDFIVNITIYGKL